MSYNLSKAKDVFAQEIEGLEKVKNIIDEQFDKAIATCIERLEIGGKLVLSGVGKSGHIGAKISATLASTGSHSVFMHPVEAMHGDLGILHKNDVLIALSYSGETEELTAILPSAKLLGVPIISITGNAESSLGKWSDIVLAVPVGKEACPFNLAPTTSTTAQLVMGDALAMVLLDVRGFTKNDFGRLHPGGAIGRAVTMKVTDLMRDEKSGRLVKISPTSTIKETILAMTKAKSGCAAIVNDNNELLGIFTDGDFRRSASDNLVLEKEVKDCMTVSPITIQDNQMAVEILNIISEKHVDDIVVLNDKKQVVGIVDNQDLPAFKVM